MLSESAISDKSASAWQDNVGPFVCHTKRKALVGHLLSAWCNKALAIKCMSTDWAYCADCTWSLCIYILFYAYIIQCIYYSMPKSVQSGDEPHGQAAIPGTFVIKLELKAVAGDPLLITG